jgi:hypothetical protein
MSFDVAERHTLRIVGDAYRNAGVPRRSWKYVTRVLDSFFRARRERNMFWLSVAGRLKKPDEVPSELRKTAFYILKKFYEKGVPARYIHWREFAAFVGKNKARDVERLLGEGTWLKLIEQYVRNEHSRRYALVPDLWPPRPGEERLYTLE